MNTCSKRFPLKQYFQRVTVCFLKTLNNLQLEIPGRCQPVVK